MNIAVIINERLNGVMLYRSVIPHSYMLGRYAVKIHFTDMVSLSLLSNEEISEFDIVHSTYSLWDKSMNVRLKEVGVKLIIDVDDYWTLDRFHELYDLYRENDTSTSIKSIIKEADAITTTTDILAKKIGRFNDNIGCFGNALMEDDYISPPNNRIPFAAWIGGATHTADLMMIQHLQKGFSIPVYIPEMYRPVFKEKFLYYDGQEVPDYLNMYNRYEIILSPLRKGKFNRFKSPLKIMEGGMFAKAMIVSNVEPFSPYLKHKQNCLVVSKPSHWGKWIRAFFNDKPMRDELGMNLNRDIKKEFCLASFTEKRWEFYCDLIGVPYIDDNPAVST